MGDVTDFEECRKQADLILEGMDLGSVFRRHFPGYVDHAKATAEEDRAGTDYVIRCESESYRVDIKLLLGKSAQPDSSRDNLPIEFYSVKEKGVRGYQGDADFILWLHRDSLRSTMAPRHTLCEFIEAQWPGLRHFCELHEKRTRMPNGYVYTSSFFWLPRWTVENLNDLAEIAA